ncbi:DUF6194 family protein (plasmid) [Streptomyces sp. BI20]|uniref:DUF6194 family protein n=1 Tax=Streptomyces sp. BI20 TaxID=3403460 RepID=UPI003C78CCA0
MNFDDTHPTMTEREVVNLLAELPDVHVETAGPGTGAPEIAWGDTFATDAPAGARPSAMPFATVVVKDYPGFDTASALDRSGVFRVNLAVGRARLAELTRGPDAEGSPVPGTGTVAGPGTGVGAGAGTRTGAAAGTEGDASRVDAAPDPTAFDRILPHPVYAAQGWIAILNPGPVTAPHLRALVHEAHARAVARRTRRDA